MNPGSPIPTIDLQPRQIGTNSSLKRWSCRTVAIAPNLAIGMLCRSVTAARPRGRGFLLQAAAGDAPVLKGGLRRQGRTALPPSVSGCLAAGCSGRRRCPGHAPGRRPGTSGAAPAAAVPPPSSRNPDRSCRTRPAGRSSPGACRTVRPCTPACAPGRPTPRPRRVRKASGSRARSSLPASPRRPPGSRRPAASTACAGSRCARSPFLRAPWRQARALPRLADPSLLRDRSLCLRRRFAAARLTKRGSSTLSPELSAARSAIPGSTPVTPSASTAFAGSGAGRPSSARVEAWNLPVGVRDTATGLIRPAISRCGTALTVPTLTRCGHDMACRPCRFLKRG